IADAYRRKYGVNPITINNTFPLPSRVPEIAVSDHPGLKLYWFSQTIGPDRGLEDVVRAMGLAEAPGELHLRGRADTKYVRELRQLACDYAPRVELAIHAPVAPDEMVAMCRGYDV